jgi:hypothetical protein
LPFPSANGIGRLLDQRPGANISYFFPNYTPFA